VKIDSLIEFGLCTTKAPRMYRLNRNKEREREREKSTVSFPSAFSSYNPPEDKVYGAICISPENKVLLVRGRASQKWSFPKGHKERNEPSFHCAMRELYEETGINISNDTNSCELPYKKFKVGGYYVLDLDTEIVPVPRDTREIVDAKWMSQEDIQECITAETANVDVRQFSTYLTIKSISSQSSEEEQTPINV
jgi:8-oxo-dGTP pyrophosphatase MutT (NUDIX family)